jgi:hypothetical protein
MLTYIAPAISLFFMPSATNPATRCSVGVSCPRLGPVSRAQRHVLLRASGGEDLEPVLTAPFDRAAKQRGLADPGLAPDGQAGRSELDVADERLDAVQLEPTTDHLGHRHRLLRALRPFHADDDASWMPRSPGPAGSGLRPCAAGQAAG